MRRWRWVASAAALLVAAVFVARALAGQWAALTALDLAFAWEWPWLGTAVALVALTYGLQIASWRVLLRGWGQRLAPGAAARIWFLANLGRYVPGKVWSVAGLVVLAEREGVARWAAAGSAFAVQAVGLAAAALVVGASGVSVGQALGVGVAAVVAGLALAALAAPPLVAWWSARVPALGALRPLPLGAVAVSLGLTALSWVGYGAALDALARGLFGAGRAPGLALASGAFALAYLAGLLVLVAPGGMVVRETMLTGLLASALGGGTALALALASRLLLTCTEAAAGVVGLVLPGTPIERPS